MDGEGFDYRRLTSAGELNKRTVNLFCERVRRRIFVVACVYVCPLRFERENIYVRWACSSWLRRFLGDEVCAEDKMERELCIAVSFTRAFFVECFSNICAMV